MGIKLIILVFFAVFLGMAFSDAKERASVGGRAFLVGPIHVVLVSDSRTAVYAVLIGVAPYYFTR